MQDVERNLENLVAVFFGEVGDRSDQACAGLPQLRATFGRRVVPHDRARCRAAGFLERAQRAERARIVDGADDDAARLAGAEVLAHRFEAVAEHAIAVDVGGAAAFEVRAHLFHPDEHAGQTHLGQASCSLQCHEHDLVDDLSAPMLLRPSTEVTPADQARFVIVRAEVRRARMWNLDRDQRDVRFAILGGDDRRNLLVGLEFDDEVDALAHENVGVALRDPRAVAVVDANELDAFGGSGALQAG